MITSCTPGPKIKGDKQYVSSTQVSSQGWNHTFNEEIISLYFTPGGLISIWTRSKFEKEMPQQWFFNPKNGVKIWNGSINSGLLVTDRPSPVFLLRMESEKVAMVCISPDDGKELWRKQTEDKIIYAGANPASEVVFLISIPEYKKSLGNTSEAVFRAFSITNGTEVFKTALGKLTLTLATPDDIVSISDGLAYFAYGGKAIAFSMSSGEMIWQESLASTIVKKEPHINFWHPTRGGMIFVSGHHVHLFSQKSGVVWNRDIGDDLFPRTIEVVDAGVLLSYWWDRGVGVMLLDSRNGKILWNHKTATEKEIRSPKGIVVLEDSVLYSVNNKLISVNLRDGSERFTSKTGEKAKVYADFKYLLKKGGRAVFIGDWNITALDTRTGKVAWGFTGFETPYATWAGYAKFAQALTIGTRMAEHSMHPTPGIQYYYLNKYDTSNLNIPILNKNDIFIGGKRYRREDVAKVFELLGSGEHFLHMIGIGSAVKPGALRGGVHPEKYAAFMNSLQTIVSATFKGNIAVVHLETGALTFHSILSGGTQCSPVAFADSAMHRIIEVYQPVGLFCKKTKMVDILEMKTPND